LALCFEYFSNSWANKFIGGGKLGSPSNARLTQINSRTRLSFIPMRRRPQQSPKRGIRRHKTPVQSHEFPDAGSFVSGGGA
jgi:hypothetical protein